MPEGRVLSPKPAGYDGVIGVSGVKLNFEFASSSPCGSDKFSNYGPKVDLAAPFWALSTVPLNAYENETSGWCGTSFAAPHVAGVAALIRGEYPTLTREQVIGAMFASADDAWGPGWDEKFGHGIVDAFAALQAAEDSVSAGGPGGGGCPDPDGCTTELRQVPDTGRVGARRER